MQNACASGGGVPPTEPAPLLDMEKKEREKDQKGSLVRMEGEVRGKQFLFGLWCVFVCCCCCLERRGNRGSWRTNGEREGEPPGRERKNHGERKGEPPGRERENHRGEREEKISDNPQEH